MGAGASDLPPIADGLRMRGRAGLADVVGLVLDLEERRSLVPSERRAQDPPPLWRSKASRMHSACVDRAGATQALAVTVQAILTADDSESGEAT